MKPVFLGIFVVASLLASSAEAVTLLETVTLVNHYNPGPGLHSENPSQTLHINIPSGSEYLPGFSGSFDLGYGASVSSEVTRRGTECGSSPNNPAAYVQALNFERDTAFFGVGQSCVKPGQLDPAKVIISGYIGSGIAYSYHNGLNAVLTFCTPEAYRANGRCP
jgi:hypothetical protein